MEDPVDGCGLLDLLFMISLKLDRLQDLLDDPRTATLYTFTCIATPYINYMYDHCIYKVICIATTREHLVTGPNCMLSSGLSEHVHFHTDKADLRTKLDVSSYTRDD